MVEDGSPSAENDPVSRLAGEFSPTDQPIAYVKGLRAEAVQSRVLQKLPSENNSVQSEEVNRDNVGIEPQPSHAAEPSSGKPLIFTRRPNTIVDFPEDSVHKEG